MQVLEWAAPASPPLSACPFTGWPEAAEIIPATYSSTGTTRLSMM